MKKIISSLFVLSAFALILVSCKKEENQIIIEGGTPPAFTASTAGPLLLIKDNAADPAITLSWTNPNYMFNTGVSSQDVNYVLQVDTEGSNFSSALMQESVFTNDLTTTLTHKDLNTILTRMELSSGVEHNVEMRVKTTLANGSVPLYSNSLSLKVTPYLDFVVEPPGTVANNYDDGELWAVGDAFASGWSNPLPSPYDVDQKFTRIDILHYEAVLNFNATGGYKLIQQQGVWGTQYHALAPNLALSGSFEKRDSDPQFPSPGPGLYKVEVNFQTGKYKLTPQ